MNDLAYLSIDEARAAFDSAELSPVELVRAQLEQADAWDAPISAIAHRMDERALDHARAAEEELRRGARRSPIHGIPVTIKDLVDVAGVPMEAGSRLLAGNIPARSAHVVEQLEAAGAIVLAKMRTHEFAWGGTTPPARNPWRPDCIPGGSSGGSAAGLAAGIGTASIGSDTAGSVRSPASFNGVVGHKPTYGLIGRSGLVPMAWSMDTVGVFGRSVADAALTLAAVAGPDPRDATSVQTDVEVQPLQRGADGLRIGVPERPFFDATQADVEAMQRAAIAGLEATGAEVVPLVLRDLGAFEAALDAAFIIGAAEAAAWHGDWLRTRRAEYSEDVLYYLDVGAEVSAVSYIDAQRTRRVVTEAFAAAHAQVDVIATPTHTHVAPPVDEEVVEYDRGEPLHRDPAGVRCLCAVNLAGLPAVSVPVGLVRDRPVAVQLIGPALADQTVLRAAAALEETAGFLGNRPVCPT